MTLNETINSIFGPGVTAKEKTRVGGGDINDSSVLHLSDGRKVFIKENRGMPDDFFTAEEEGLNALKSTGTIPVVSALGSGSEGRSSFLLLECVNSASRSRLFWEDFGHNLAALHKADTKDFTPGGSFGFKCDNFIGATRQYNKPSSTFIDFYRSSRLEPQFKMAWEYFDDNTRKNARLLLDTLDRFLLEPGHPSLLHGDLWGGNFMTDENGNAMLIDPAVYVGHAEADIAMTELFGGFSPAFYDSYREAAPMQPGYADRRDLYNLYHLTNHLNLFGPSYLSSVKRIIMRYAAL